jgi:hypothetical protein
MPGDRTPKGKREKAMGGWVLNSEELPLEGSMDVGEAESYSVTPSDISAVIQRPTLAVVWVGRPQFKAGPKQKGKKTLQNLPEK